MLSTIFTIACVGLGMLFGSADVVTSGPIIVPPPNPHSTDGSIGANEWTGPGVNFVDFTQSGAGLYAEQVVHPDHTATLYLLYDYYSHPATDVTNSFFDVFFQVPNDADYLVRIQNGSISTFEKSPGTDAKEDPFDPLSTDPSNPWSPLSPSDLALADFVGVEGVGTNPNPNAADTGDDTSHLLAEFELSVNTAASGDPATGIYSPDRAFWSASEGSFVGGVAVDPPLTSGFFTLGAPGGHVTIFPAFGPSGLPVSQPQDVASPAPEAPSLAVWSLLSLTGLTIIGWRKYRTVPTLPASA